MTTVQTALCIIPPEDLWEQIQAIRSMHDKAYPRWMPHINLIYPFVPEANFENIKKILELALHHKRPFPIQFDQTSLHYFRQRGDECTYHLRPKRSTDVIELQQVIQNQLSNLQTKKKPFEAHLTLGQTTAGNITKVLDEIQTKWKPIEFTVDRVFMISRENQPDNLFVIKQEILLLGQENASLSPMASNITMEPMNYLSIVLPNEFSSHITQLFERTSFQPLKSLRIVLGEYESGPVNSELRSRLETASKFTLEFGRDSLAFDEKTSSLVLKPLNTEPIQRLYVLDDTKHDGSLILGVLHRDDFDRVNDRFVKSWTADKYQFDIDRIHLTDTDGRIRFIFRLKNPCLF